MTHELKTYMGIIKLFGFITIDSVETITIRVYSNPEKWNGERLKSIKPIFRRLCSVKWIAT